MKKLFFIISLFIATAASGQGSLFSAIGSLGGATTSTSTPVNTIFLAIDDNNNTMAFMITSVSEQTAALFCIDSKQEILNVPSKVNFNNTIYTVTAIGAFDRRVAVGMNGMATVAQRGFLGISLKQYNKPNKKNVLRDLLRMPGEGRYKEYGIKALMGSNYSPIDPTNYALRKVIIPSTVTTISGNAFADCMALTEVEFPETVTNISYTAFTNSPVSTTDQNLMDRLTPANNPAMAQTMQQGSAQTMSAAKPKEPSSDIDVNIPQVQQDNDKTFAFIIANENYSDVAHVDFALNDGKAVEKYCKQTLGLPDENVRTYFDATLNKIRSALRTMKQIGEAYNGNAQFIVYYAGHGIPDEASGDSYLLPVDGDGADIATGLSLKEMYETIAQIQSRNTVIFMDACFSGSLRGDGMLVSARGAGIKAKKSAPAGNMVVFSAAQGDETAWPDRKKEHGMFTYFLLKKLQETKGEATLQELSDYISTEVRQRSVVVNSKSQTPSTQVSPALGDEWKKLTLK